MLCSVTMGWVGGPKIRFWLYNMCRPLASLGLMYRWRRSVMNWLPSSVELGWQILAPRLIDDLGQFITLSVHPPLSTARRAKQRVARVHLRQLTVFEFASERLPLNACARAVQFLSPCMAQTYACLSAVLMLYHVIVVTHQLSCSACSDRSDKIQTADRLPVSKLNVVCTFVTDHLEFPVERSVGCVSVCVSTGQLPN